MSTKREYLVSLGLAKPGRGKFSKAALEALSRAMAEGMVFDEPEYKVQQAKTTGPVRVPPKASNKVRAWAKNAGYPIGDRGKIPNEVKAAYLAEFGGISEPAESEQIFEESDEPVEFPWDKSNGLPSLLTPDPIVRNVRSMFGVTADGFTVGFSMCSRCAQWVARCDCPEGIKPPSMVVEVLDRTDPITVD